jgi:hypothetical protein
MVITQAGDAMKCNNRLACLRLYHTDSFYCLPLCCLTSPALAAHGTKLDDVWIKPNVAKQLRIGSRFQLGASTRTYVVAELQRV